MDLLPIGWRPKALAVDIDGTMTDGQKILHPGAIKALRSIEDAGLPIILATGNVRPIVYGLWRLLGLSGPMVCENGGVVWNPPSGELQVLAEGQRARAAAEWLADRIDGLDAEGIESNAWRQSEWCLRVREDADLIRAHLSASEWSDLIVVRTGFAIHLTEPGLDKAAGLRIACSMMGIDVGDVLAVGDAPNDIPMFEICGHSVAVGGAFEAAAQAADVLSTHPHGETLVALALELAN